MELERCKVVLGSPPGAGGEFVPVRSPHDLLELCDGLRSTSVRGGEPLLELSEDVCDRFEGCHGGEAEAEVEVEGRGEGRVLGDGGG